MKTTQRRAADTSPTSPASSSSAASPTGSGRSVSPTAVAHVAVFTALIVAASIVPAIPIGALAVPITLQTLAVLLTGLVLGPVRGGLAVLLYLVLGFAGLPVFAKGASGLQVLSGPTGGYLVGFLLAALLGGALARLVVRRMAQSRWPFGLSVASLVAGLLVVHPLGIAGLMANAKLPFAKALSVDLAFVPGDIAKALLAALVATAVHRAFPSILARD